MQHLKEVREFDGFRLSEKQRQHIDQVLAESDTVREFVRCCLKQASGSQPVTTNALLGAYVTYCASQEWESLPLA
jgi:hypothetical protein